MCIYTHIELVWKHFFSWKERRNTLKFFEGWVLSGFGFIVPLPELQNILKLERSWSNHPKNLTAGIKYCIWSCLWCIQEIVPYTYSCCPFSFFFHTLMMPLIISIIFIHQSHTIYVAMLCIVLRAGTKVLISGKNVLLAKIQIKVLALIM